MTRLEKQFLYGGIYLIFWLVVGFSVYYFFFLGAPGCFDNIKNQDEEGMDCGGPCISCALKNAQPLLVSPVDIFDNGNNNLTILGEIYNPNALVGAERFNYEISLYSGAGRELYHKKNQGFIYPAATKVIIETGVNLGAGEAATGKITVKDIVWQPQEKFGSAPEEKLEARDTKTRWLGQKFLVSGTAVNNNSFVLPRLAVKTILSDKEGQRLAAGITVLENLGPFGEKKFHITVSAPEATAGRTDIAQTRILFEIK